MQNEKCRIGWYCPYTFIPLSEMDGVEPVRISWGAAGNGSYGCIKLCRKLTSVQEYISKNMLDGLVMADCCELSHAVYNQTAMGSTGFAVYLMKIPSRHSSEIQDFLYGEWDELKAKIQKKPGRCGHASSDYILNENDKEDRWCKMPVDAINMLQSGGKTEAVSILARQVFCPKMHYGNKLHDPRIIDSHAVIYSKIEDTECLAQNYWAMYSWEVTLGSKADE